MMLSLVASVKLGILLVTSQFRCVPTSQFRFVFSPFRTFSEWSLALTRPLLQSKRLMFDVLIHFLRIYFWGVWIMRFDHIHSCPLILPKYLLLLLIHHFALFVPIKTNLYCPYILEGRVFHWSMASLPGTTVAEKTISPSPRSHQSSTLPQLEVELCAQLWSPCWGVAGLRSCTCCHNHCEIICAVVLLCPEDSVFFAAIDCLRLL